MMKLLKDITEINTMDAEQEKPKQKRKYNYTKKTGRPLSYTKEVGDRICELTETTRYGYVKLSKLYEGIPDFETFTRWRSQIPEFNEQYQTAKARQAAYCIESITEEVEDTLLYYHTRDGEKKIDSASVAYAKLLSDNRRWVAAKLAPKLYGDARDLEIERTRNAALQAELDALRAKLDKVNASEF